MEAWDLEAHVNDFVTWASSDIPRIPTGMPVIDTRIRGVAPGEMLLFLARSGVGKTWWAVNVVANNHLTPTVFISLEMSARYVAQRLAATYCDVSTRLIEERAALGQRHWALEKIIADFPHLAIVDRPRMTWNDIASVVEEISDVWGTRARLVIVDFLELVGGAAAVEQVSVVDKLAQQAKDTARKLEVALVVLHQVSRTAGQEGWKPLSMISGRWGGEISADYLVGAYRPALAPEQPTDDLRIICLQLLKSRSGWQTYPQGLPYQINLESGRIRPITEPKMVQSGWQDLGFDE
jgi:replicative DNA helicase